MTPEGQEPDAEGPAQPSQDGREEDIERRGRVRIPRRAPRLAPDFEIGETLHGSKPGSLRVRRTPRSQRLFTSTGEGELRAEAAALQPRSGAERAIRVFKRIVVGAPLASGRLVEERLTKLKALAVFSSDMLSSSAYATEEILLVLLLVGTSAFVYATPISVAIAILAILVTVSYRQVIRGYPGGGGSYAVAKENLGMWPGLIAGGSLIVDYVLTVAVSTSAGVAAIASAVPELQDLKIELAVGFVALITLANLRGIRESGTFLALPAYVFIASMGVMIIAGAARLALGQDLQADAPPEAIAAGGQTLSVFLLLRAFSSGSAALTGIEAVSNGVPSFKAPEPKNAGIVLMWMAAILTFLFLGITILAHEVGAAPSDEKTIVAQVADTVFSDVTPLFYVVQVATMLILVLAANTAFAGLPSLGSVMARDGFLPRQLAFRGDRLAFSNGIMLLGLASMAMLVLFRADTHALIPLYAVGVFIGFTLSQVGMVFHWRRDDSPGARRSLIINAVGAVATGLVAVIIAATKFFDGAWLTLVAIAVMMFFLSRIHRHYQRVKEQLEVADDVPAPVEPAVDGHRQHAVLVPVDDLNRAVLRTLDYARSLSENVTALHVTDDVREADELRERWEKVVPDVPMVTIESPYRSLIAPVFAYIDALDKATPGVGVTVVLPEFIPAHFWEGLLHNQSALRLKRALLGRPNTVVIDVPYHLRP